MFNNTKRKYRLVKVLPYGQIVVARLAKTLTGFGAGPESAPIQVNNSSSYLPKSIFTPLFYRLVKVLPYGQTIVARLAKTLAGGARGGRSPSRRNLP